MTEAKESTPSEYPEPEYSPEFIKELLERAEGKHVGPFSSIEELDTYIDGLPDEDE